METKYKDYIFFQGNLLTLLLFCIAGGFTLPLIKITGVQAIVNLVEILNVLYNFTVASQQEVLFYLSKDS